MSLQEAAGWKDDKSSLADYEHPVGERLNLFYKSNDYLPILSGW